MRFMAGCLGLCGAMLGFLWMDFVFIVDYLKFMCIFAVDLLLMILC